MVDGFPNMMMLIGPHMALGNIPRSIEYNVDWVTGLMRHARDQGLTRLEATEDGVTAWTDHVKSLGVGLLSNEVDSWMTGVNRNVAGKQVRIINRYSGSAPAYRAKCDEVAANGYAGLTLASSGTRGAGSDGKSATRSGRVGSAYVTVIAEVTRAPGKRAGALRHHPQIVGAGCAGALNHCPQPFV